MYRLNVLNSIVDYFVIVEATCTFTGKEKILYFNENKHLFEKFKDKIIHIIVDDMPYKYPNIDFGSNHQWTNDHFQRNAISRGINAIKIDDNDMLMLCDLDEIPDPRTIASIKSGTINVDMNALEMDLYYYNLHTRFLYKWYLPKVLLYKKYKETNMSIQNIRDIGSPIIKNGGWHLSYFGDNEFIKNKIAAFAHQELNVEEYTNKEKINNRVKNGFDLYDRENPVKIAIKDNTYLPLDYEKYLTKFYNETVFHENWYSNEQAVVLANLVTEVKGLEGSIIEIGCWEGKSTSSIANACYPETVICNDTWLGNVEESKLTGLVHPSELIAKQRDVYATFLKNMVSLTKNNFSVVKQDCLQWLETYKGPVKFCHIDASHEYYSVHKTISLLLPHVVTGGILCGDDIVSSNKYRTDLHGGVERAVEELLPGYKAVGNLWFWKKV
jgi:beta-1,4-mannosyl-glycoprotein beta-1,4-N-acetylglucosaminyltransferase